MLLSAAIVPFQLSLATLGEVGGGYDSTAVDLRSGRYVDAPVISVAAEGQVQYVGERVRHALRNRSEIFYEGTGDRDVLDSDVFNVTRYAMSWEPTDGLSLHTDGSYAIGAPTMFFSRAGRPDVSFARHALAYPHQLIAYYALRQALLYHFTEFDTLELEAAVEGQYPATPQLPGQYMFTPYAASRFTHQLGEDDTGHVGTRIEYLNLELFRPVWLGQLFVGWSHNFDEWANTLVEGGITLVQENLGAPSWDVQPYFRARGYLRSERQRMLFGASYTHTFGVVSATIGTGELDLATVTGLWFPGHQGNWSVFGDLAIQHGAGFDPASQIPIVATFATLAAGARYRIHPLVHLFVRYEFQWETDSALRAAGQPDFVRHVALAGVQVAWGTDEQARLALIPIEELDALEHSYGIGPDPSASPVRTAEPVQDERDLRRRERLPGDPLDGEDHENGTDDTVPGSSAPLPGDEQQLPGDIDLPDTADPFQNEDAR